MASGECSNFTAYGMAPASLVAPLDAVAVMSNVMLSRILFRERISRAGVICVGMVTLGTVATALNAPKVEGSVLEKESYVFECILSYRSAAFVSVISIASLWVANPLDWSMGVSHQARRLNPFYYCFLCGSMGTLTVVSAKGISTAMSNAVMNGNTAMFNDPSICWITYLLYIAISISIILQMKYSHTAFHNFGSSLVLAVYYVIFTIITIAAGVVIFQESVFDSSHYAPLFLAGLVLTYTGIFTLSRDDISLYMATDFDQRHLTRVVVVRE